MSSIQINQRPTTQPQSTQRAPQLAVQAQVQNHQQAPAAPNGDLQGLLSGLASFNPAIQNYQQALQAEQELADKKGQEQGMAQAEALPTDAITGAELSIPDNLPVAYHPGLRKGFNQGVGQRQGLLNKQEMADEYVANERDPDFMAKVQAGTWQNEWRQKALAGVTDPVKIAIVGKHLDEFGVDIATRLRSATHAKAEAALVANASALTSGVFTANMSAPQMVSAMGSWREQLAPMGITPAERGQYLLNQINTLSQKMGGVESLYGVFDAKGADGKSVLEESPALVQNVLQARHQAKASAAAALAEKVKPALAVRLYDMEKRADAGDATLTNEYIFGHIGAANIFGSEEQAVAMAMRRDKARETLAAAHALDGAFDNGTLGRHAPEVQQKVLEQRMGVLTDSLYTAKTGAPVDVAAIGRTILNGHSASGATVPYEPLKRYFDTFVTGMTTKGGPTPEFKQVAALFASMSGEKTYRNMYVDEKKSLLLQDYLDGVNAGTDPVAAYEAAYAAHDPARVKMAEAVTRDPESVKRVAEVARTAVIGSSIFPAWIGGNGRPEETRYLASLATGALNGYIRRNPEATEKQQKEYVDSWVKGNAVFDPESKSIIQVPPDLAGSHTQEVFSAHSKALLTQLRVGSRSDSDWTIRYTPADSAGNFTVRAFNGVASQALPPVSIREMTQQDLARRHWSAEDGAAMAAYKADPAKSPLSPELFAKAQALRVMSPQDVQTYRKVNLESLKARAAAIPKMAFGDPVDGLAPPRDIGVPSDNQRTSEYALRALGGAVQTSGAAHIAKAASIVTMREGVRLRAYPDPAAGAGMNIGTGYNFNANKATLEKDLMDAGIDKSQIPLVVAGQVEITPRQSERLTMNVITRHEKQAREVAEASAPGLWDKMTPSQKAVMIDINWQVGSTDKFKKAWAALAKGDAVAFGEEVKTYYTPKGGTALVEDKGASGLRAAMLAGSDQWDATVRKRGSYPSDRLGALGAR